MGIHTWNTPAMFNLLQLSNGGKQGYSVGSDFSYIGAAIYWQKMCNEFEIVFRLCGFGTYILNYLHTLLAVGKLRINENKRKRGRENAVFKFRRTKGISAEPIHLFLFSKAIKYVPM